STARYQWLDAGIGTFCPLGAVTGAFFAPNDPSQNTNRIVIQKNNTLNEIMFAPNPIVWVKAHGELSRMISLTCQNNRTDERIYPISPIIQVNEVASMIRAYCDLTEICPHAIGPVSLAPFNINALSVTPMNRHDSVEATCGTDSPTRTFAGI